MFEGVFPLPQPDYAKGKSSRMCALEKAQDSQINPSGQDHEGVAQPPAAQPMILHGIVFNPDNDDAVMEDASPMPYHCKPAALKITQAPEPSDHRAITNKVRCTPNPMKSELSKKINTGQLLSKISGTELTLMVGKALGTLRDISHSLAEALKYNQPTELRENLVGATIFNRN